MKKLILFFMLLAGPALADPCDKLTEEQCQIVILSQSIGQQAMLESEVAARSFKMKRDAEIREKQWRDYFAAYIGAKSD